MNEFLTDNTRKAYPLERELPPGVKPLWGQLLSDACIGTSAELDGERLALISVERIHTRLLQITVGTAGDTLSIDIPAGLGEFAVVAASSDTMKAILTVNGKIADDIMGDDEYATEDPVPVGVPFALRCTSSAQRRVTDISAYTPAAGHECESPQFAGAGAETAALTISEDDVTIAAKDGLDLEVIELMPLTGRLLRLSAIAAPAGTVAADEAVDIMLRGDDCITVETIPGTVKVGTVCKPCCQCEDYKAAVDALRGPEDMMYMVKQTLDDAKVLYDQAIAAFNQAKADAEANINSIGNVRVRAVSALSPAGYGGVDAKGTRQRISITLYVENMTLKPATVSSIGFTVTDDDAGVSSPLPLVGGFGTGDAEWGTLVNGGTASRVAVLPVILEPGGTLAVTAVYARSATTNEAARPTGVMAADVWVAVGTGTAQKRTVDVT